MELVELTTLAGTVGGSVGLAIKYAAKQIETYRKQAIEERDADRKERIQQQERLLDQLDDLMKTNQSVNDTNRDMAEVIRKLTEEYNIKINNIENNLLVINEKLSNQINLDKGCSHENI